MTAVKGEMPADWREKMSDTTQLKLPDDIEDVTGSLKVVLGAGGANGLSVADVRIRMRIMDKLDRLEEVASCVVWLTKEELTVLKSAWDNFRFGGAHADIVKMDDAINEAMASVLG